MEKASYLVVYCLATPFFVSNLYSHINIFKIDSHDINCEADMKIITTKEFGESIRNKRKLLGYTQAYVVSVSGLSVMFISDLERGKKDNMGFDMYLYRLSKHFFDYPEAQYPEIMCKESRLCIPGI